MSKKQKDTGKSQRAVEKDRLLASTLLAGVASLGVPVAAGVATVALAPEAMAQSYTQGAVQGQVLSESGSPVANAEVTITSQSQGFSRSAQTSSSGGYSFNGLPGGRYDITVGGQTETVTVVAGQTVGFNITASGGGDEAIVVTGTRVTQSFANTTTGLSIDVADLVEDVPVGRNLTSLITLAPGTTVGESQFGNLASIGGASVAENAYYINGLNITDFDTYLGSALVPFDFYRYVDVKSGGYPAEFGRATGGIVNAVTKSGTNDFMAAIHGSWSPDELQEYGDDLQNCSGGYPPASCVPATIRSQDHSESYSTTLEMGGAIIPDRLFAYGLLELRRTETQTNSATGNTLTQDVSDDPFWGIKLDAYPLEDHHLEFTYFDTRRTTNRTIYSITQSPYAVGAQNNQSDFNLGGINYVGQYTGHFTDWLTFSAAVGQYNNRFDNTLISPADNYFINSTGVTAFGVGNGGFFNAQRTTTIDTPYDTVRDFWRADVDIFFSIFGDHHVRAGVDDEQNTLDHSSIRSGRTNNGQEAIYILRRCSTTNSARCNGTPDLNAGDYYVEINHYQSGGSFDAENQAYYIQDEWRPTDRLTLNLGVRWDNFEVQQADGQTLVNLEDNLGLRLGGSYDLDDEGNSRIFGSFSQYYLPVASNTSFRMTSAEEYWREYWTITGVSGGQPVLGSQITGFTGASNATACPAPLTSGSGPAGTVGCVVTGDGTPGQSITQISRSLEATQEDEYVIGFEHQFNDRWSFGVSATHRELIQSAEDMAIDAAVLNYCAANAIANCSDTWTGFHQYVLANPGEDLTVQLAGLANQTVTFTAAQLAAIGFGQHAERTYDALEFTFRRDRMEGDRWDIAGSYTLSESRGNSEGFVQSDFGQDDAGITQDFDQPGFLDGANGLLPNHRRHRLKLWGSYDVTDAFTIGSQVQIYSPRPLSCFGGHPTDPFANAYGAASHYCNLDGSGSVLSPRGTASESDWIYNVDLSFRYNIDVAGGLTLRADVFNVFNFQNAQDRNEFGELGGFSPNPNYNQTTVYQTPRTIRLGFDLQF